MKESDVRKILKVLKDIGFLSQNDQPVDINLNLDSKVSGLSLIEFKAFEAESNTDLSKQELSDIYQSIAKLHELDSNQFQSLLYQLRAIKYAPFNKELRLTYLGDFHRIILDNRENLSSYHLITIIQEVDRLKNYVELKWGINNEVSKKCLQIQNTLKSTEGELENRENKDWNLFIRNWEEINRKYRPDDQALDYASQIIVDQLNS